MKSEPVRNTRMGSRLYQTAAFSYKKKARNFKMAGCYIPIPVVCNDCSKAPNIGENGNWWIGDEDSRISAQGPAGEPGVEGMAGI